MLFFIHITDSITSTVLCTNNTVHPVALLVLFNATVGAEHGRISVCEMKKKPFKLELYLHFLCGLGVRQRRGQQAERSWVRGSVSHLSHHRTVHQSVWQTHQS